MLQARKAVSKKTLHEEHSIECFGLRLLLVVDLMGWVSMVKTMSIENLR